MLWQIAKIRIYSFLFHYCTENLMLLLCVLSAIIIFSAASPRLIDKAKAVLLVVATGVSAFLGARILHVLIERPELLKTPEVIFTQFDGMTFNGSLLFGVATFFLGLYFFTPADRLRLWDRAAIVTALSYGLMRIGCFSNGCCWGSISGVPWAVKYFHSKVMPWHGIPVHPVQLYDSLLGFFICAVLVNLKVRKKTPDGRLFPVFLVLYSVGRFVTEFFRGDSIRGENLFLSLSTSQLVSVGILSGFAVFWLLKTQGFRAKRVLAFAALSLLMAGCLPEAPSDGQFRSVQRGEALEVYQTYRTQGEIHNILFLAADDYIQDGFAPELKAAYQPQTPPRLEDIVFWEYLKDMRSAYNIIARIPEAQVGHESFSAGLKYMESLDQPYDVMILTHGFPNYLSTGTGYFFSYNDLDLLKGSLKHLSLVMLQSCFGESLVPDFKAAGAQKVMSYPDENQNFFFFGFFLKYYDPGVVGAQEAYAQAQEHFDYDVVGSLVYSQIAALLMPIQTHEPTRARPPTQQQLIQYLHSMPAPVLE